MIAIRDGTAPVHLSEQEIVDCSNSKASKVVKGTYNNYGCNGGWPDEVWRYVRYNGLSTDSDYPYLAKQSRSCLQ